MKLFKYKITRAKFQPALRCLRKYEKDKDSRYIITKLIKNKTIQKEMFLYSLKL